MSGLLVVLRHGQSWSDDEHRFTGRPTGSWPRPAGPKPSRLDGHCTRVGLWPELVLTSVLHTVESWLKGARVAAGW